MCIKLNNHLKKHIKYFIFILISLTAISFWIYNGLYPSKTSEEVHTHEDVNDPNIIFNLIKKDITIEDIINIKEISNITYLQDSMNYFSIFKNNSTHNTKISKIIPKETSELISMSYSSETIRNYQKYLHKKNDKKWKQNINNLEEDDNFNIYEFAKFIDNEIGLFTFKTQPLFYIKSKEHHNLSSILLFVQQKKDIKIDEDKSIYKIRRGDIPNMLIGEEICKEKKYNFFIRIKDYFILSTKKDVLQEIYEQYKNDQTLSLNQKYTNSIKTQYSHYHINYYSDISSYLEQESDSIKKSIAITYNIRSEKKSIINKFNMHYLDIQVNDSTRKDSLTENIKDTSDIISTIVKETIKSQEKQETKELGESIYTIKEGSDFLRSSAIFKDQLSTEGYDYEKIKHEHIKFVIRNGSIKLNWNEAIKRFMQEKEDVQPGDYFYFKKF